MQFGQFVMREIKRRESFGFERLFDFFHIVGIGGLHTHENVGVRVVTHAVVEFRHSSVAEQTAQAAEGTALFGNRHGKHSFSVFAEFGALASLEKDPNIPSRSGIEELHP